MKVAYRVLIVDDDPQALEIAGDEFESYGLSVETYHTRSVPSVDEFADVEFDAFLIDVMFPESDIDGFDFVEKLKDRRGEGLAVALMSNAAEEPKYARKAAETGLPLYPKSEVFKPDGVKSLVDRFFQTRPIKALVCDDSDEGLLLIAEILLECGFDVVAATEVGSALEVLSLGGIHIAFVDVFWKVSGEQRSTGGLEILGALSASTLPPLVVAYSKHSAAFSGDLGEDIHGVSDARLRLGVTLPEKIEALLTDACPFLEK